MKSLLGLSIIIAILYSCSGDNDDMFMISEPMHVSSVEIPDTVSLGQEIAFTIDSYLPSSCWEYSHLKITADGNDIYVTPIMTRDVRMQICFLEVRDVDVHGAYFPLNRGRYLFHFHRGYGPPLDIAVWVR